MRVASLERSYLLEMDKRYPGFFRKVISANPIVSQGGGGMYSCISGKDLETGIFGWGKTIEAAIEDWARALEKHSK
jgi:hypothetical protein